MRKVKFCVSIGEISESEIFELSDEEEITHWQMLEEVRDWVEQITEYWYEEVE